MKPDFAEFLPLNPAVLQILLALAGEDLHGYGIMQEVLHQSEGRCKIGPGTLYDNLSRLVQNGFVHEVDGPEPEKTRRRYYRLSSLGKSVLSGEIDRLEKVVRDGRSSLSARRPRRA
jgi:DNA-binding PadR family transcriptional regulator